MNATREPMKLRTSAAEAVTDQMRRELLDGTIAAGSRILPKDLAERFLVSIVPVREALRRLEAEGLVVTSPQRATFAAEIGLEDLAGVYELRCMLEGDFAERAAEAATVEERERCQAALDTLLATQTHSLEFYEAHRIFHWRLLEPAASGVAKGILERLWVSVDRYMSFAAKNAPEFSGERYRKNFYRAHSDLAAAFVSGDGKRLRRLLVDHLSETEIALGKAYSALPAAAV